MVDVVELVFIFSIVLIEVSLVNFPEFMKVIGTFRVCAFMDDKVPAVLLRSSHQGCRTLNDG
jgi:hypothetical protein